MSPLKRLTLRNPAVKADPRSGSAPRETKARFREFSQLH